MSTIAGPRLRALRFPALTGANLATTSIAFLLAAAPFLPWTPIDVVNTAILWFIYTIVTVSVVLLVGYVGQISLAQASFMGLGAFTAAGAVQRLGLQFPWVLIVGVGAGAVGAAAVGIVALRVRGLFLAVATLIFAYVCDQYVFRQPFLVPNGSGVSIPFESVGAPGTLPFFDLGDPRVFYYIALAVALATVYAVGHVRESRVGRAFQSLRGSEVAAASLGIDVTAYKLRAFALSGALAGLAGSLVLLNQRNVVPTQFYFTQSLFFLAIAVVGGLRSLGGGVASSAVFALLVGEVFFRFPRLADFLDLISGFLLLAVLLFFVGGLGQVPAAIGGWVGRRRPEETPKTADVTSEPTETVDVRSLLSIAVPMGRDRFASLAGAKSVKDAVHAFMEADEATRESAAGRPPSEVLGASGITVRFGGLTAVNGVNLSVREGEIVGVIGPNGAGKTTFFNALLGLNSPAAGKVELFGRDVSRMSAHLRAARGLSRTFQLIQLFADLDITENLLAATHLHGKSGLFGGMFVSPRSQREETAARARVAAVLSMMGLSNLAHRTVGGLPFGTLRLVEVARTIVAGGRLICLDEPASGLDTTETETLIDWLRFLRACGASLLVIEHDVSMVMRLCDYIYVLDQGTLIAEGTPAEVRANAKVVASYLGTAHA
jgi:ABC-type branched-subunit amino acid transport system ATPase component/ABC-type branched-subunit amino acid transport system permease subunit